MHAERSGKMVVNSSTVFSVPINSDCITKQDLELERGTSEKKTIANPSRVLTVPNNFVYGTKYFAKNPVGQENEGKHHDHSVLLTTYLFAKLNSILKVPYNNQVSTTLKSYLNIFNYCTTNLQEQVDGENVGMDSARKASTADIIFLWGITSGISAEVLKTRLQGTHDAFSEDFEVRLVDRSCAVLVFWKPSIAAELLKVINSGGEGYNALRELIEEGLRAANYDAYKRVCRLGFWETDLADLLDKILAHCPDDSKQDSSEILWSSDLINLEDL
ncbi:hypothetical protein GIB67_012544 [Kingdonia uniflora]|uniref:Uncharacterized protein n=1 Tax=Kingdonia uniflora TaxID=39325 RepID=A0A7J7N5I0_9MAGN|nr:hypothetical protein GIB67_012544 [Kingdonia uniflora]